MLGNSKNILAYKVKIEIGAFFRRNNLEACPIFYKVSGTLLIMLFIISMTKLLDADWSRGVQLFH